MRNVLSEAEQEEEADFGEGVKTADQ